MNLDRLDLDELANAADALRAAHREGDVQGIERAVARIRATLDAGEASPPEETVPADSSSS